MKIPWNFILCNFFSMLVLWTSLGQPAELKLWQLCDEFGWVLKMNLLYLRKVEFWLICSGGQSILTRIVPIEVGVRQPMPRISLDRVLGSGWVQWGSYREVGGQMGSGGQTSSTTQSCPRVGLTRGSGRVTILPDFGGSGQHFGFF